MRRLVHYLEEVPFASVLHSFSSLDTYFRLSDAPVLHVYTEADLIDLAKVFGQLEYPGWDGIDAMLSFPEGSILFRCVASVRRPPALPLNVTNFLYDPAGMKYLDPYGVYPYVRRKVVRDIRATDPLSAIAYDWNDVMNAAILLSRYRAKLDPALRRAMIHGSGAVEESDFLSAGNGNGSGGPEVRTGAAGGDHGPGGAGNGSGAGAPGRPTTTVGNRSEPITLNDHVQPLLSGVRPAGRDPSVAEQRLFLVELLSGKNPKAGFELLQRTGFIESFWPEFIPMYDVSHSKEQHPEGNVWQHTLETFAYRKVPDLTLSLGLLFHDSGKPYAHRSEGRMFDGHSQIGVKMASDFLHRLGFEHSLISDVLFLVREHMLPGFLVELPTYRTEKTMSSELFPLLLELYRCDLSSTYRGPDGYYRACKVYRSFLKNVRNPFRTADGKKIIRMYVD